MSDSAAGPVTVEPVSAIASIPAEAWDACTGQANPFVTHRFLAALERSGSAVRATGWLPQHLVARDSTGAVLGVAPCYVKSHSFGEFVFDWAWADAFERAGGRYYPKLQLAVPFTPVTGPRLAVRSDAAEPDTIRRGLAEAATEFAQKLDLSSVHVTFPPKGEVDALAERGWLQRLGQQYHFANPGYGDFDAFLADLASRKRKQIRRERRAVAESGARLHRLTGSDIKGQHWDAFFDLYQETGEQKFGVPYLTRAFFEEIAATMADEVLLVMAELDGDWIAGAINFIGGDTLYGRNWGCRWGTRDRVPFLHFEACYYQAIEYAIAHGLQRVEAGAQGEHKIQRGYLPTPTYSLHWIAHQGLHDGVAGFLERERELMSAAMAELSSHSPYRREG